MNVFERLEQSIGGLLRKAGGAGRQPLEPLEIRRDAMKEITGEIQPKGGGEYFFPHTAIQLEVFARDSAHAQVLEGLFENRSFASDLVTELEGRGCAGTKPQVSIRVIEDAPRAGARPPFRVAYSRSEPAAKEPPKERPPARLTVLAGRAAAANLEIDRDLIYIGRTKEVLNKRSGVDRYNHLAFDDSETKVSRKHAFLRYDPMSGLFRAFNDPESQAGTTVVRNGRVMSCDSLRGIPLRTGDEIILGDARIRFDLL